MLQNRIFRKQKTVVSTAKCHPTNSSKELQVRAAIQQSLNDHILSSFAKRFLRVKLSLCIQTEQAYEKNCINDKINLHQHLYCWQSIVTTTTTPV